MTVGGTWDVDEGLAALWDSQGLDVAFREKWPNDKRDDFASLEWSEGGEEQPFPFALAEVGESYLDHRSTGTGTDDTRVEVYNVPLLIVVYGRSKKEARDLGRIVATALETCAWTGCSGWHETNRLGDSLVRDEQRKTWALSLRYLVRLEHEKPNA